MPPALSSGTLNLRFMRRAQPEQAHAVDDARWELAPAYRAEKPVTYETSYLPFLFPSLHDASESLRPRGRRVFGHQPVPLPPTPPQNTPQDTPRPHSISSIGPARNKPPKSAKNIIFDASGVGSDLRRSSSAVDGPAHPAKTSDPTKSALPSSTGATTSPNTTAKRSRAAAEADKPKKKTKRTLIE